MQDTIPTPAAELALGLPATDKPAAPIVSEVDSLDRPFNAEKFRHEKDKVGRWKNKHAGRKSSKAAKVIPREKAAAPAAIAAAAPDLSDIAKAALPPPPTLEEAQAFDAESLTVENPTAETIIGGIQTALVLIGQEEGVMNNLEKDMLRRPLLRVLAKYEIGSDMLPAELDLVLAIVALVITRLKKPNTATAMAKFRHWCIEFFFNSKGRRLAKQVEEVTS